MRILVAPDSFKGSLSAVEVVLAIATGLKDILKENCEIEKCPMADGGEHTVDIITKHLGISISYIDASGSFGDARRIPYALTHEGWVIIDYASVSGLDLLKPSERDPGRATSYGFGEALRKLLDKGYRRFCLFLGGSAGADGGAGALQALGLRLLDKTGNDLDLGGASLIQLKRIDTSNFIKKLAKSDFILAYDVRNPLCGPNGSARIFGPQKGASPELVRVLEQGLERFADVVNQHTGHEIACIEGGAAAGGVLAGFSAFFNCERRLGFDQVSSFIDLKSKISRSDLVVTGEGQLDSQSRSGKVVFGVGTLAKSLKRPVVAIVGGIHPLGDDNFVDFVDAVIPITTYPMTLQEAINHAPTLLRFAGRQLANCLLIGDKLPFYSK